MGTAWERHLSRPVTWRNKVWGFMKVGVCRRVCGLGSRSRLTRIEYMGRDGKGRADANRHKSDEMKRVQTCAKSGSDD